MARCDRWPRQDRAVWLPIVGARGGFAEIDRIALHEQLHAENALSTEGLRDQRERPGIPVAVVDPEEDLLLVRFGKDVCRCDLCIDSTRAEITGVGVKRIHHHCLQGNVVAGIGFELW